MPNSPIDPWYLDASGEPDPFLRTDFSHRPEDDEINLPDRPDPVVNVDPIQSLNPDVVLVEGDRIIPPPPDPEPDGPEIVDLPDGGTLTFQKTSKGWEAILDNGTSAKPEIFKGKNKNELMVSLAVGKLNATKKIRELNREVKLGPGQNQPQQVQAPNLQSRQLTADEIFEIKTTLDSNPDLAFSNWFQKKTGLNVEDLVTLAKKGANANTEISMDATNRTFLAANPDYYGDPDFKNFNALVRYLSKNKLNQVSTDKNAFDYAVKLHEAGLWTVENLEEAFQELSDDGLLISAPRSSKQPQPEPVVVEPIPRPPDGRIVQQVTRPRAALGIRSSDVTPVANSGFHRAPSVEDVAQTKKAITDWADEADQAAFDKAYQTAIAEQRRQRRRN